MFEKRKLIEQLKKENKSKSLQITILLRENEKLKYKCHQIQMEIDKFNFLNDNTFSLLNRIKKEAKYE